MIADHLPARFLDRLALLGPQPARVEPLAWTPAEWDRRRAKNDPIVSEAIAVGVWLVGEPPPAPSD